MTLNAVETVNGEATVPLNAVETMIRAATTTLNAVDTHTRAAGSTFARRDTRTRVAGSTGLLIVEGFTAQDYVLPLLGVEGKYHTREIWLYRDQLRENMTLRANRMEH